MESSTKVHSCSYFLNPGQCLVRMSTKKPQRRDLCCFLFSLNPDPGLVERITAESPTRVQSCLSCLNCGIFNEGPQLFVFSKPGPMPGQDANHGSPKVGPVLLPVFIKPGPMSGREDNCRISNVSPKLPFVSKLWNPQRRSTVVRIS